MSQHYRKEKGWGVFCYYAEVTAVDGVEVAVMVGCAAFGAFVALLTGYAGAVPPVVSVAATLHVAVVPVAF